MQFQNANNSSKNCISETQKTRILPQSYFSYANIKKQKLNILQNVKITLKKEEPDMIDNKIHSDCKIKTREKINKAECSGLLHYRNWWERIEVDISVNGTLLTGTPIFVEDNTLRVINGQYSYFIPVEKVDYIRTNDGLNSCGDSTDRITHKLFQ